MKNKMLLAVVAAFSMFISGCTAVAVVDAAASTAVGVTKVAVKGTTAAVGAVIPDDEDKKASKKKRD